MANVMQMLLLFFAEAIWGLVSLHTWIFFFSGVAVFYILLHLKNKPKL